MPKIDNDSFKLHLAPDQLQTAIEYTAAQTGFQPELVEKDYYCTLVLKQLNQAPDKSLVFKGGTLLAKGYAGFYRLSEDLDFSLPISPSASRKQRSALAKPLKALVSEIPIQLKNIVVEKALNGSNESRQYNAELQYLSCLSRDYGKILVEIGLREELQTPPVLTGLNTLLLNSFTSAPYLPPIRFYCLSQTEAYAEKIRAALCREKLAIRDFYDIDYALKRQLLDLSDPKFIKIVQSKIATTHSQLIEFDDDRLLLLKERIHTELMPTLNQPSTFQFNLEEIIAQLKIFREKILINL